MSFTAPTFTFDALKKDFVWLPKGLIVPLQLISRYFFLRSKSSKESLRVSKFDSLVDKLSKQVTVKVNNWIVAEVRKCLKKALMVPLDLEGFDFAALDLDGNVF